MGKTKARGTFFCLEVHDTPYDGTTYELGFLKSTSPSRKRFIYEYIF
jgi:hypothetical protein